MMEVKDILRQRRIELGLTMREVADAVGVSEGTISRWESGRIENMKRSRIVALSQVLRLSPTTIMGWTKDEEEEVHQILMQTAINKQRHDKYKEILDPLTEDEISQVFQFAEFLVSQRKEKT